MEKINLLNIWEALQKKIIKQQNKNTSEKSKQIRYI